MSARTCLLCGKPLSRIWAGTGEDFCSREHRNQYRLRRGMDRLTEANQLATVMRRREQTKQIPTSGLRAPGPVERRAFLDPLQHPTPPIATPVMQMGSRPRLQSTSRFRAPRAAAGEFAEARDASAPLIPMRALVVPRVGAWLVAHVNCAPPSMRRRPRNQKTGRRVASLRWAVRARLVAARLGIDERRAEFPVRIAKVPPCRGRALRVSLSAAFRVTGWMAPVIQFAEPRTYDLPRPKAKRSIAALRPPARERIVHEISTEPQAMRLPLAPPPKFERRFLWPEALNVTLSFRNTANGRRSSSVPFGSPDELQSKEKK